MMPLRTLTFGFWVFAVLIVRPALALGHEFSGVLEAEARLFATSAIHPDQEDGSASFAFQPEYYHEWESGSSFAFVPFLRVDSADSARTHFDIRELTFLSLHEDFELRTGVRKVFWGVTEVLHLIDIINQTDQVENVDAEDKLGQPMVNLSLARDWGTLDLFWLPYFRERTFPGADGRLRGATVIDTSRTVYQSSAEVWNSDWAFRYSKVLDEWDVGIAHFMGTGREPTLLDGGTDDRGNPLKIPFYEQINQTSVDISYVPGNWLWKFEGLFRAGQGNEDYFAMTGGFEYTLNGIFASVMDLGFIVEGMFDERGRRATTAFENDVVFGLRLSANDAASTEALFGWVQDTEDSARFIFLEASRRIAANWTLNVEVRTFFSQPGNDFLFDERADEMMQMELAYHF